jgi:hypothetical protein
VCVCVFTILLLLFMKWALSIGQMIVVKWDLQCKSCCMPTDPVGLRLVEWVGRSSSWCMWKFLNQWKDLLQNLVAYNWVLWIEWWTSDFWHPSACMLSFLGFFSHFPVNAFFLFLQWDIEKPTHAALGPQVLKHPERVDGYEVILFYFTLGLFGRLICVFLFSRVSNFFSHFSCRILIFQLDAHIL